MFLHELKLLSHIIVQDGHRNGVFGNDVKLGTEQVTVLNHRGSVHRAGNDIITIRTGIGGVFI